MRYLLIDRINRLEYNKQITAIKNVALSEDIFNEHFVGFPVMPGALQIEALAQAGTALLEVSVKFKKKALLIMVDQAKFRNIVRPGDQLTITMDILTLDTEIAQMSGKIQISEQQIMTAKMTFALKSVEEYYPQKLRHLVDAIYDVWLQDAEIIGLKLKEEGS